MSPSELRLIKARVLPTICDTYRSENGYAEARVEGRISKADFEALCAAVEDIDKMKSVLDSFGSIVWAYGSPSLVRKYEDATGTKLDD